MEALIVLCSSRTFSSEKTKHNVESYKMNFGTESIHAELGETIVAHKIRKAPRGGRDAVN